MSRFSLTGPDGNALAEGIVLEVANGLQWAQDVIKAKNWEDAKKKAEALDLGGHTDWRLPTVEDLFLLADRTRCNPAIDTKFFPKTPTNDWYWSSSAVAGLPGLAWGVGFYGGFAYYYGRYNAGFVRAVRGASPRQ